MPRNYLGEFDNYNARQIMKEGSTPAAANGHFGIVLFLLKDVGPDNEVDDDAAWIAFLQGAAHGFVEIVELAASYVSPRDIKFKLNVTTAMSNAISGGHVEVVGFLLLWEKWKYDAGDIFEKAMINEQHEVAKKIYEIYPQVKAGRNLLVDLASLGRLDAVKY